MQVAAAKKYIEKLIHDALGFPSGRAGEPAFSLAEPPDAAWGDYATNAALLSAKKIGARPQVVAAELIGKIKALDKGKDYFDEIYEKSGFINFRLSKKYLLANLASIAAQGEAYGSSRSGAGQKLLVEYFQNNVAKPPHVGHLRSAVIGDSLRRIFASQGYAVVADTHIGDWGVQFGILIYAYKTLGKREAVEADPITELNKLYVAMSAEIEKNPDLREKGKAEFVKLEQGDAENRKLWQWFVDLSKADFERYRQLLGLLPFDYNLGESYYENQMPGVLADLRAQPGLLEHSDGAQIVNLKSGNRLYRDKDLGTAVIVKSDGGTTYLLRDLATIRYRVRDLKLFKVLYVVDNRQAHHFQQVFEIAARLGYTTGETTSLRHVDFGFMSLPEGAISTRKGTTVSLQSLLDETERRVLATIEEKNPALADKPAVAKKVALGAMKYFDLAHNRKSDIVFRWDEILDFEGNSGPYLQYAYVRVSGIERKLRQKSSAEGPAVSDRTPLADSELQLLRKLVKFNDVLEAAMAEYMPHYVARYLFELSQDFSRFYEAVWVLKEKDTALKSFRLQLIRATGRLLKNGLGLLGIEAPEEM